ncbi:hypothetical protein L6452_08864 [Arctium lappa]|uniref:Uncharacterized protein n=1 Tax=Arctium lappa TaxID=4217 RepID=A0ACB9DIW4_ARCLA|nr:hypothetical protein L6452_08864 [Arctium lappa]
MKHRSKFFDIYCRFRAYVKTQHNFVIKCFRCDLGGEYTSNKFCELLALDGTIYQTSCTYTPKQNGVAERKHKHILETARSLLLSSSVPNQFWGEAVLIAFNLINKIPSSITSAMTSTHWTTVVHILRYLRGTMFQSLLLSSTSSLELRAYSNAIYVRNPTDRRSVTAEYRAMASTSKEIIWLLWLLADMGVFLPHPTSMYCDNRSAIQIAHNSVFHERTKHIEVDCHFTHHHLKRGTLSLPLVSSTLQLADFFTKSHSISRFRFLVSKLSMLLAPAS